LVDKRKCRVIVFVDGQNVHNDLRRAFLPDPETAHPRFGAFNPMALAQRLVARGPEFEDWTLSQVRAYVGAPVAAHQPKAAAAHDRQMEAWRAWGVTPVARPLSYLNWPNERPRQKGVDAALAVDVVRMGVGDEYQIGIILSTDTDVLPAIETVSGIRGTNATPRICGVRYGDLPKRLYHADALGRTMHAFHVTADDFAAVRDDTNYAVEPAPELFPGSS
jgi:hypothetical protein